MDTLGTVAILGYGPVGQHLTALLHDGGYEVVVGVRNPEVLAAGDVPPAVQCVRWRAAAEVADVIVLAVPYDAINDIVAGWPAGGAARIVVDPTNPIALSPDGQIVSGLDGDETVGTRLAKLLPSETVVRAFTHVMAELLAVRGRRQPGLWAMAVAGDDSSAKEMVGELVKATGFAPVDIGGLAESAPLDPGGVLFPQMFTVAGMKRRLLEGA
ncbi:NADPH-dependent F420 reductase [Actinoplanes sp. TFC3]|uniref:NADPH-dependent F420 reductase n=1 Tax=Actinoplanes sp. TFC3 TaxID=1710355 RepID=UPI00082DCAB8|nr:NAD(P)-binding domain-containing protein [Actinoplanes sp. TFC3]